jgi:alanine racemase
MSRPTSITVDLAAIRANLRTVKQLAPESNILAVVKANAYGHGAVPVAKSIEAYVDKLTVSCVEEATELRQEGISKPIVLLEGVFEASELDWVSANQCEPVIHNEQQLQQLIQADLASPLSVWLKIDTGMHRLGIAPTEVTRFYQALHRSKNVKGVVLLSHFSCADEISGVSTGLPDALGTPISAPTQSFTQYQGRIFEQSLRALIDANLTDFAPSDLTCSLANSAAILAWPDYHLDWVRPGIMLYGVSPFSHSQANAEQLVPAMTFSSEITALRSLDAGQSVGYGNTWVAQRPSVIATVAVGYGDGYPRSAKSGTPVLVNGQRARLVGRVSMDLITLDVTDIPSVELGSKVILWGDSLSVNEVANWSDTIGYELVTRMPNRVVPTYLNP